MSNLSLEELEESAHTITVEGRAIKIVGIEKLLEIKRAILPLRDKDLTDIKQLEKLKNSRERS
ncbi:MAG: hypothetical protein QOI04_1124 [Verrucomicrobiota bacterium]|jgi:predicted nucleotidyltransferase